jgi:monothiol glutaredoxin
LIGFGVLLACAADFKDTPIRGDRMNTVDVIKDQIANNGILLYMKGTPKFPQCGFSSQTVQALMDCGERFAFVNILEHPDIRAELPKYANWPTFPQLWINGELVGGCDIVMEMLQTGELAKMVTAAGATQDE